MPAMLLMGCSAPLPPELQPGLRSDELGLSAELVIDNNDSSPFVLISDIRRGDFDVTPGTEVMVAGSGSMTLYDESFRPLHDAVIRGPDGAPLDQFAQDAYALYTIVDVDGDETIEFFAGDQDAYVLRNSDGTVRWTIPYSSYGEDLRNHVGDLDGDGRLEFVLAYVDEYDSYAVFNHEGAFQWKVPGSVQYAYMADIDGNGIDEVVALSSNGVRSAYAGSGMLLQTAPSHTSISPVRFPANAGRDNFLSVEYRFVYPYFEETRSTIEDFAGNTLLEFESPIPQPDATCAVKFKPDTDSFLAVCWWIPFQGAALFGYQSTSAFLRIYSTSGAKVYEEVLLGRECAMTAIPGATEGTQDLLFGTLNRVWRYSASSKRAN